MIDLWNCEKLSFECLFLVRVAIVAVLSILCGALACFFIYLIVWCLSSTFGWVLIPISFAFFVYYVIQNIHNQV
ncbi:hypothetical protein DX877_11645 [Xylella fastidiosa subsp. fastidiosa]|uniref:Uncharacterized protein n=1 Tax=Xylella fastidiosa (strain M23) TaxID=405441 RepID=B2I8Y6_XYLF2|nr:hypothetical protein XfasM23_0519 [Xylella fastidiosa M23]EGO80851.1 hypothetical protein XFEB_02320 [Xylella fastidiosa EB92.1]RUA34641.1 hypothetical protein DX877_11645 [Xylella fastidiosa subsp. fastidiosa]TNV91596.1 hypothetical protein C5H25_09985 [Xylella fastidiosa]RWA32079.1 hypothetical protein XfCFBP8071_01335 [Xylella fastidiosa subsp. fastidiosa]